MVKKHRTEGSHYVKIPLRTDKNNIPNLIFRYSLNWLYFVYYKMKKSKRNFVFNGKKYNYFYNKYNFTWTNERAVEIAIVRDILRLNRGKRILEVGNVLSHYFNVGHDILDKYERSEGVINEDIVVFRPEKKYDMIISISTLEHIGWDEKPRDNKKIIRAIKNLRNILTRNGKIIITLPLGSNRYLDNLLRQGKIKFSKAYYFKRISNNNEWVETDWNQVKNSKYNYPYPFANGLIIGVLKKF